MTVCYLQQGNISIFPQLLSEQSERKQTNGTLISRDLSIYQVKPTAQILTFNLERPLRSQWMPVLTASGGLKVRQKKTMWKQQFSRTVLTESKPTKQQYEFND